MNIGKCCHHMFLDKRINPTLTELIGWLLEGSYKVLYLSSEKVPEAEVDVEALHPLVLSFQSFGIHYILR